MTLFIKDEQSILFLHVPKCGGSSIEKLFKNYGYSSTLDMRGLAPQECLTASPQHQTSQNLKSIVNMEKIKHIFIMVRNPYKRIISEFNWQFRGSRPEREARNQFMDKRFTRGGIKQLKLLRQSFSTEH